jgi:hypothetical protein
MKISERTISFLAETITGDNNISFYRTGPELVKFFNEIGFNDLYRQGFPTRRYYVEERLRELNGTKRLIKVFELLLDPRNYIKKEEMLNNIVDNLNKFLKYDGYEIVKDGDIFRIKELASGIIEVHKVVEKLSHEFIKEQIEKCDKKILSEDYDGAITNARALVETVLLEIEKKLENNVSEYEYDGDLVKLYKRVQKLLNLEPSRQDISELLKQVLGGLISIINGIASLRNKMSDSHARSYKPWKHHAVLVVNAAKTFITFIYDTYEYQKNRHFC